jgi:hypothetical protein
MGEWDGNESLSYAEAEVIGHRVARERPGKGPG